MEELQARHRKEQRELQGLITSKKKSASKKTRKGVNDDCAKLEQELKERQDQELADLRGEGGQDASEEKEPEVEAASESRTDGVDVDEVMHGVSTLAAGSNAESEHQDSRGGKKPNRQKARLARRAAEQAEIAANASKEAQNLPNLHAKEKEIMDAAIKSRGLQIKEIRADGHCLYSAVADQLAQQSVGLTPRIRPQIDAGEESYRTVRRTAAAYMVQHKEDFEPFLEEPLDQYVRKVGETGEWGGQLELMALAKAYAVHISVLDGDGKIHEIKGAAEGEGEGREIWLAYHRHGFGLGEHYNSLRKG